MTGDELGRKRAERIARAARTAGELLEVALREGGEVDDPLAQVGPDDAVFVLGALVRQLAALTAAQALREPDLLADTDADRVEPDRVEDVGTSASRGEDDGQDELPVADPWRSGDAGSDTLEAARTLFEALAEQRTVADLLRAVAALDESEAAAIVLERALAAMAERQRPSRG